MRKPLGFLRQIDDPIWDTLFSTLFQLEECPDSCSKLETCRFPSNSKGKFKISYMNFDFATFIDKSFFAE